MRRSSSCLRIWYLVLHLALLSQVLCPYTGFGRDFGQSTSSKRQGTTKATSFQILKTEDTWQDVYLETEPKGSSSHQRRLMQRQTSERGRESRGFSCSLNESVVAAMRDADNGRWLLDDAILSSLDRDIQAIINCTTENDIILFETQSTLRTQATLTIPWNLTLSGHVEGNLSRNGTMGKARDKVRLTCPTIGPLIKARTPSFALMDMTIVGCNTASDVILLEPSCGSTQNLGHAQFMHVEFSNNSLFSHGSLVNGTSAFCIHFYLEDVEFIGNSCGGEGCVLLFSNSTLHNIRVLRNRKHDASSNSCSMFSIQDGSQANVRSMSAMSNDIRIFHTYRSSMTIRESFFEKNIETQRSRHSSGTSKGGVLFGRRSKVSIQLSSFASNFASFGGAIYATLGEMKIEKCSFHKNKATDGRGGAVFINRGDMCNIISTNFTDNSAHAGGAIDTTKVSAVAKDCQFIRNHAMFGGACAFEIDSYIQFDGATFIANQAEPNWGGALAIFGRITLKIHDSMFHSNSAGENGGAIDASEDCQVHLENVTSNNNTAKVSGGSIHFHTRTKVFIVKSNFSGNEAQFGGAMCARTDSNLSISSTSLAENRARKHGGCILMEMNGKLTVHDSLFSKNVATQKGGAIMLNLGSMTTLNDVLILDNEAGKDCGGICALERTFLNATLMSVISNSANDIGGGVGLFSESSLLCHLCLFEKNVALDGAGLYVRLTNETWSIDAQLQDCRFVNNYASLSGGGLMFEGPQDNVQSYLHNGDFYGNIILLNTSFVDNFATQLGSAIVATNAEDVLVSCHYDGGRRHDFLDPDYVAILTNITPERFCKSWKGNRMETSSKDGVVGTLGKTLALSMNSPNPSSGVRLVTNNSEEIVLKNVRSGERVPEIKIVVLDAFGNENAPTVPRSLLIDVTSPDEFFQGVLTISTTLGRGSFSNIVGFKPPGYYTIKITPQSPTIVVSILNISVPNCHIGEEPTNGGELCQRCDEFSYNFNVSNPKGCTPCPKGSTCEGHYIVPIRGNWHKGLCHTTVAQCIVEEACTYDNRTKTLYNFGRNLNGCDLSNETLALYGEHLCHKGYEGPLCGSCSKGYGLSLRFSCLKCPSSVESIITLILFTIYLLVLCAFALRGGLPYQGKQTCAIVGPSSRPFPTWSTSRSLAINIQMVEMIRERTVPPEEVQPLQQTDTPTSTPQQANDPEMTRWKTSEILKILINFLQVTATMAGVVVHWTSGIMTMFEASEYVGALTTVAISRPVDCIVSSNSALARSIWRIAFSFLVLGIVFGIFVAFWSVITIVQKKSRWHFVKRTILSVLIVVYISYLGLTKLAVRVFYCVDIVDSENPFLPRKTSYWAVDTAIQCYGREHVSLIVIGAIVIILVTLFFPLFSAIIVHRYKSQTEDLGSFVPETMGFLYRAFKEEYKYWESIIMFRKACMSVIVVFSYQLGGQLQTILALLVLLLSLYFHATCKPYRKELKVLNHYEAASLCISCVTLTLGLVFESEKCSNSVKLAIACLIFVLNVIVFLVLLVAYICSGINHMRAALEDKGIQISEDERWWNVIKIMANYSILSYMRGNCVR